MAGTAASLPQSPHLTRAQTASRLALIRAVPPLPRSCGAIAGTDGGVAQFTQRIAADDQPCARGTRSRRQRLRAAIRRVDLPRQPPDGVGGRRDLLIAADVIPDIVETTVNVTAHLTTAVLASGPARTNN